MRTQQSLNGWWDFLPDLTEAGRTHHEPGPVPVQGWIEGAILVPGSWSRGEGSPENGNDHSRPWLAWRLHDNYGYPPEWNVTTTAWYRTRFTLAEQAPGQRWFLLFGGVLREAWVFVNGQAVGRSVNGILPLECEVTEVVRQGANELVVFVTDYRRDENGKAFSPIGSGQMVHQKGIWQDVYLAGRPDVYVDDVTIRTSVRKNELTLLATIRNASSRARTVQPLVSVKEPHAIALQFACGSLTLAPGEGRTIDIHRPWTSFRAWSPPNPTLYMLEMRLAESETIIDCHAERFGFREIWLDDHRIVLNGTPIHLAGDWCHKSSFDSFRPEYLRQWFRMLKDCNMNYVRTHTFPHPRILLDIADEMGILVSVEAGWHFGSALALDKEELWAGAEQQVQEIIRRDKNHPSVILWSIGNEVRWSGNNEAIIRNMPRLYALYERLDPTRIPYHDGSSSLWDERTQYLLSRHYGPECTGEQWWDKSKPLHVGEMGKWHYGQPIDNTVWGDDRVFDSFRDCHRAIAHEAADIIEQARANEVACIFPWNLSGLDNYRPWPKERTFEYADPGAPHLKPLRSAPYGSEFAWWEPDSKGYAPGVSFETIKHAFRPFALVIRERLCRFFDDQAINHSVTLVNDTGGAVRGLLRIRCFHWENGVWEWSQEITIGSGLTRCIMVEIPPVRVTHETAARIETVFADRSGEYDRVNRSVKISPAMIRFEAWEIGEVALFGEGAIGKLLRDHGVKVQHVTTMERLDPASVKLLVIEKDAIRAGTRHNRQLQLYVRAGGRVVVFEQHANALPQLHLEAKPSPRCHIRAGSQDLLKGFSAVDFAFWGEDPYGKPDPDSLVVENPYRKPACGISRVLLESGFGDFGHGGLNWAPLIEVREGTGILLACQLRIADCAGVNPTALKLLRRLLTHAANWKPVPLVPVEAWGERSRAYLQRLGIRTGEQGKSWVIAVSDSLDRAAARDLAVRVNSGAIAVVSRMDPGSIAAIARVFDIDLRSVDLGPQYNLVRTKDDPLLEGISNQETYWLDKAHYGSSQSTNRLMTETLIECSIGQPLLTSERESCWREFYTLGAKSELLRMAVVTHLLWNGPRPHAAGMMRIPHGQGQLVLCQIPFPEDAYDKADVFWLNIFRNLNAAIERSVFEGDFAVMGSRQSDGFPATVRYMVDPSSDLRAQILRVSRPKEMRMHNQALLDAFGWGRAQCPEGVFSLVQSAREVVIAFEVHPGRSRREVREDGGLPDPDAQTLFDVRGKGKITLHVNGMAYPTIDVEEGRATTVPGIDLEVGWNSVVLVWNPVPNAGAGEPLRLLWRNRQQHAEVEFRFEGEG